jgi:hypothetical protein
MDNLIPLLYNSIPPIVWFALAVIALYMLWQSATHFMKDTRENSKIQLDILQELRTKNAVQDSKLESHENRIESLEDKMFIVKQGKK